MKQFRFSELSKAAKSRAIELQRKYNFPNLSDSEIEEKVSKWMFTKQGDLFMMDLSFDGKGLIISGYVN